MTRAGVCFFLALTATLATVDPGTQPSRPAPVKAATRSHQLPQRGNAKPRISPIPLDVQRWVPQERIPGV